MTSEEKVVLVLGAGASVHCGYPTSSELIKKIIGDISEGEEDYIRFINVFGTTPVVNIQDRGRKSLEADFRELRQLINETYPISIDTFLNQISHSLPHLIMPGKILIAGHILGKEGKDVFSSSGCVVRNWYRILYDRLTRKGVAKPKQLLEENLNLHVITFNYDLSLEYYLYKRFADTLSYFDNRENAFSFLKKVDDNIIHVYGQVGKFEWSNETSISPPRRLLKDYGAYHDNRLFGAAVKFHNQIFLINEERSTQSARIRKVLADADSIYFIGYGFHQENNDLIDLEGILNSEKSQNIFYMNKDQHPCIKKIFDRENLRGKCRTESSGKDAFEALNQDFGF